MKLKMIESYPKRQTLIGADGLPVLDEVTNTPKFRIVTKWRYAIIGATAQEIELYKKFRRQDGEDYYRTVTLKDGSEVPVYVSNDFLGREIELKSYETAEGRIGFRADTTAQDELLAISEKFPVLAGTVAGELKAMLTSGSKATLLELNSGDDGEGSGASNQGTGAAVEAEAGEEGEKKSL